jgi:hypothetical protein
MFNQSFTDKCLLLVADQAIAGCACRRREPTGQPVHRVVGEWELKLLLASDATFLGSNISPMSLDHTF